MRSVSETLQEASAILQKSEIAEPRREAASLLAFVLRRDKIFLIAHPEYELSSAEAIRFQDFIWRRARREPFQYIVGRQEFYGLDFLVTPDVLIPRPETEMIVEWAIEILRAKENPRFCEVGIGSGCIAVSILHSAQTSSAIGLDVSANALKVARKNAEMHRVSERLETKISDVFDDLTAEKFDLIVSNPPYIPRADIETLQSEVRDFEPLAALTDGGDGLSVIEKIIGGAPELLKPNGFLLMEIGINQAGEVEAMFDSANWREVEILPDLQNIPRTVKARNAKR